MSIETVGGGGTECIPEQDRATRSRRPVNHDGFDLPAPLVRVRISCTGKFRSLQLKKRKGRCFILDLEQMLQWDQDLNLFF